MVVRLRPARSSVEDPIAPSPKPHASTVATRDAHTRSPCLILGDLEGRGSWADRCSDVPSQFPRQKSTPICQRFSANARAPAQRSDLVGPLEAAEMTTIRSLWGACRAAVHVPHT